jgi:hypothetical protein
LFAASFFFSFRLNFVIGSGQNGTGGLHTVYPHLSFFIFFIFFLQNVLLRQVKKVWGVGGGLNNKRRKNNQEEEEVN